MQKITMEDLGSITTLSQVSFSPNGAVAAYVVSETSIKDNCYRSYIWVLEDGVSKKLTSVGKESTFIWLDDETLLFPGDRTQAHPTEPGQACTVYNKINIHGGEAQELFVIPMKASSIYRVSEEEYLFLGTYNHYGIDVTKLEGKEKEEAIARIKEEEDYEIFDELPFWANAKGVVNKLRNRLYLFHTKSGECRLLSPDYMNVSGFDYQPQSDRVLYYGHDYQWMDDQMDDLYVRQLHGEQSISVQLEHQYSLKGAHFMGDSIIMAGTTGKIYGNNENPIHMMADPATGAVTKLADLDPSMGSSVGTDCRHGGGRTQKATKQAWYYLETIGYSSYIVRFDRQGVETVVSPKKNGSIDCFDYHDGKLLYVAIRSNGLQELYTCEEGAAEETKLTCFNDEFLAEHAVSPAEYFPFTNQDGVALDGWVIKPVDYDPKKSYPAILDVHGGPKVVYGDILYHEMQLWASEGYFVMFCNPRGGDGRGNEFADIRGDRYGVWDYNDLMEFTDQVLESYPQIDQARVGMTGGSYGGFMANWIVGHTDRFAAVASQRSISNYFSKCLTTDIGYYHNLKAIQADPWSNPESMWHHSPLKYADRCKTPTLFIQSDEDYRCWMCDALQMFTALRMHGVPTRLCLFHGENHGLSRDGKPKHRIRRLREITDWFNHYLK